MTVPLTAEAQDNPKKPRKNKPVVQKTKWDEMDIGSFQAYGLEGQLAGKLWRPALKGLNIDLGNNAAICFDTERLRVAAAWTGGFIKLPSGRDGLQGVPKITGDLAFHTPMSPGWAGLKNEWEEPNPPVVNGKGCHKGITWISTHANAGGK